MDPARVPRSGSVCRNCVGLFTPPRVRCASVVGPRRDRSQSDSSAGPAGIRLSTLRPVTNDLLNDALWLDNELSALAATCSLRSVSKVQINHLGLSTESFIKSQNAMACILSFVERIQLKIWHDIEKCVLLIVTKFGSDTMSHFAAVTE